MRNGISRAETFRIVRASTPSMITPPNMRQPYTQANKRVRNFVTSSFRPDQLHPDGNWHGLKISDSEMSVPLALEIQPVGPVDATFGDYFSERIFSRAADIRAIAPRAHVCLSRGQYYPCRA